MSEVKPIYHAIQINDEYLQFVIKEGKFFRIFGHYDDYVIVEELTKEYILHELEIYKRKSLHDSFAEQIIKLIESIKNG